MDSIKLSLRDTQPALALKNGVLVHTASAAAPVNLDIAAFINQGREGRSQDLAGR